MAGEWVNQFTVHTHTHTHGHAVFAALDLRSLPIFFRVWTPRQAEARAPAKPLFKPQPQSLPADASRSADRGPRI